MANLTAVPYYDCTEEELQELIQQDESDDEE